MRVWRRIGPLLAVVLVFTPLMAFAPISLPVDGGVQEAEAAPTFRLPWKAGQSWYVTADNASSNHNDPAFYPDLNRFAFDAQPLGADPTVVAIVGGEVIVAVNSVEYSEDEAYKVADSGGNCVAIDHGGGVYSAYAHMETGSVPVQVGQRVEAGQPIGRAGRTGYVFANSPLLHWTATSTKPDSRCLNGLSSPSTYADVGGDGIPRAGNSYTSGNSGEVVVPEPPPPAETPAPTETATPVETPTPTKTAVATETAQVVAPIETSVSATPTAQDSDMVSVSVAVWIDCLDTDTCHTVMYVPITATTLDGAFLDTCTVTVDPEGPLPGCSVRVPAGTTVVLTEDASAFPAGYAPNENPIIFDTADVGQAQYDAGFRNTYQGADDTTAQTSVFIWTKENGQVVYDACYVLVDYRDVACDENGNGYVFFSQVPSGTYTVRQVADLGPNRYVEDFTIEVTGIGDPGAPYPGMEMFSTEVISTPGASTGSGSSGTSAPAEPSAPTEVAVATESTGSADPMSLLPTIADVPGDLVETGRYTRTLPDVAGNYTDPAETTQLFTNWGWQGNAVASFALPSGQQAQSGQVNGIYVSIHRFSDAGAAREALDFSLTEQAAGTVLQEITTGPLGEYTRALYGPEDYGNEITILVQQGSLFIRVSVAMLDGDPTADAVAVTEATLRNVTAPQTTTIDQDTSGTTGSANTPGSGNASGTGGLTVEVWDNRNNMRDTTSQCVQLAGVSEMLCSYDSPDGLIQFDGIPAGTYEICVTRRFEVPAGEPYWSWARSLGPVSVTIAPGSHEAITLYVFMVFQNPDPGDPTLCGFDPRASDSSGSASSDTGGSVITSDSSGAVITPGSGEATLLMTFRGCPEGFDPDVGDFYANCTIPLDAPDNAFLEWGGDGQGGMYVTQLDRQYNGAYVHSALSDTMNLRLLGLAPVVRDGYQVFGADGGDGNAYSVYLTDGETREIFVFYYYE